MLMIRENEGKQQYREEKIELANDKGHLMLESY